MRTLGTAIRDAASWLGVSQATTQGKLHVSVWRRLPLPGRSVICAAAEKARARISNVTINPAMPDAAKIKATITN
jgi:hypothetical protein